MVTSGSATCSLLLTSARAGTGLRSACRWVWRRVDYGRPYRGPLGGLTRRLTTLGPLPAECDHPLEEGLGFRIGTADVDSRERSPFLIAYSIFQSGPSPKEPKRAHCKQA